MRGKRTAIPDLCRGEAAMPSYADRLTEDELADVIAYLVSLKGL